MIAYTITGIVPHLVAGELQNIGFMVTARDGDFEGSASWNGPVSMPSGGEPYTDAALEAKCYEIADRLGLRDGLRQDIENRKARPPVAPPPSPPALTDGQKRDLWMSLVDSTIEFILRKHTRFQMGYTEREAAAMAYKDSGYTIEPTVWVTRFADNVGMTYPAAANLILTQAANLRTALVELEALRMDKYLIQRGTITQAEAEFDRIVAMANQISGDL